MYDEVSTRAPSCTLRQVMTLYREGNCAMEMLSELSLRVPTHSVHRLSGSAVLAVSSQIPTSLCFLVILHTVYVLPILQSAD